MSLEVEKAYAKDRQAVIDRWEKEIADWVELAKGASPESSAIIQSIIEDMQEMVNDLKGV